MIFKIIFLVIFSFLFGNSDELKVSQIENIQKTIKAFQENDIEYISNNLIKYPLKRQYPIPSIKNQEELKKRFSEVFDDELIKEIKNSKIEDWSEMGWRGIMLNQGTLWLNFDQIIIAINYQSDFEKRLRENLIKQDKEQLHSSLKDFIEPTYKIKTKNFLIRIDKIDDSKYRYSSWKIGRSQSSKPDLVLLNGEIEYQGTIGYQYFTFKNRNYTYEIDIDATSLEVMKDNKTILFEKGELLN
ncbi:hypothetical protein [Aliarcobacter lanthieri]|uniref:hypothetical protein n=1 Tax=Aliarcobacter lanthieri TaxID=1355374 RepID=UPI00047BE0CB|nr:hypothetical protein [Aliarcobacter lanthieri]QKF59448.1 hypothetical protein ALANTH_1341 [Aliarcobacter lanthieri]